MAAPDGARRARPFFPAMRESGKRPPTRRPPSLPLRTEEQLAALALALAGGEAFPPPSGDGAVSPGAGLVASARSLIAAGEDPLGDALARLRPPEIRRKSGATYTPTVIVDSMFRWAASAGNPARVVDPGAGSGRFLLAAAARFPEAQLFAVEIDPLAVLILRANLAVRRLSGRTTVLLGDYRTAPLPPLDGVTLFAGNPPYVRHHDIEEKGKRWFAETAARFGVKASRLAGSHLHFFLRTLELARPGDYGTFITSSEWLDVNYGAALRRLLAGRLGGTALHVIDPSAMPFDDAMTTGVITCFRVGDRPEALRVRTVRRIERLGGLSGGRPVSWEAAARAARWSPIVRPGPRLPPGSVAVGDLFRVHRGQVTGRNETWIAGPHASDLPARYLLPAVTRARELFDAGAELRDAGSLRRVVDLPADLDRLERGERSAVMRFLDRARRDGADRSYVARHRRAWWSVGLREPAPVLCTYMARRPPAFVLNRCGARHLNIAHGLYPREPLPEASLLRIVSWLRRHAGMDGGRTYAGGLTKFEPGEVERIPIPDLRTLAR